MADDVGGSQVPDMMRRPGQAKYSVPLALVSSHHNTPKKLLFAIALSQVRLTSSSSHKARRDAERRMKDAGDEKADLATRIGHCQYLASQYAALHEEQGAVPFKCRERLLWQMQESFAGLVSKASSICSMSVAPLEFIVSTYLQISSDLRSRESSSLEADRNLAESAATNFETQCYRHIEMLSTKLARQILQTCGVELFFADDSSFVGGGPAREKTCCVSLVDNLISEFVQNIFKTPQWHMLTLLLSCRMLSWRFRQSTARSARLASSAFARRLLR